MRNFQIMINCLLQITGPTAYPGYLHPPLYAPYAASLHSPYLPAIPSPGKSAAPVAPTTVAPAPSPIRERDSFSNR